MNSHQSMIAIHSFDSSDTSSIPCLVCRSRKVRCDKSLPECRNCERLGVQCPGYNVDTQTISRSEIQKSAENIFKASGVEKRRVGSCEECRASKHRCTRTRPSCRRCLNKGLPCVYPDKHDRPENQPPQDSRVHPAEASSRTEVPDAYQARQARQSSTMFADIGVKLDELYSETLPENHALRTCLVEKYFDRSHSLRCLSFLDRSTFMQSLERDSVIQDYGQPLLYVMCALGARHVNYDFATAYDLGSSKLTTIPGEAWAERARKDILSEIATPSISHLMTMVLLCDYGIRADQNSMVFVLVSFLYRVIRLHGLDNPDPLPASPDQSVLRQRDMENRLVWACYFIDLFTATGVDKNACWKGTIPNIPLPLINHPNTPQHPPSENGLLEVEELGVVPFIQNLDLSALLILVVRLRMTSLRLIRTNPEVLEEDISDAKSPYTKTIQQMMVILQHLPDRYHLTDTSIPTLQQQHMLGGVFLLHYLMHAVISDITRPALPGFNFPLSTAFHSISADFRSQCQERCRFHARQTTDLIRRGMMYGREAFDDQYAADAALESIKIQIIYAAAVNQDPRVVRETGESLQVTLGFFELFNRGNVTPSPYIRTLMPLCFLFGFRDVAEPYRGPHAPDSDAAEVVGSADNEHLSRFAPFRRARSSLKAQPTSSTQTSSSRYTRPSPPAQQAQDSVGPNLQKSQVPMAIGSEQQMIPETQQSYQAFIPPGGLDQGFYATPAAPMMSQTGTMMTDMTIPQPSTDDYVRTADEMSGYLTWDMMDIPPMLDYGNYFPTE